MENKKANFRKGILWLLLIITGIAVVNVAANYFFMRLDLTAEKRYTLSNSSKKYLKT